MTESPVLEHTPSDNGAATGRDERGRFARGNSGGPVNPFGRKAAALRAVLIDCITPQVFRASLAVLTGLDATRGWSVEWLMVRDRQSERPLEAKVFCKI